VTLAICGLGLVTPFGTTPTEHVYYLRAGVPAPPASPFETKDGDRVDVSFCRFLGAAAPIEERLLQLGERALATAMAPLAAWVKPSETRVLLVTARPRPGLDQYASARLEKHVAAHGSETRKFFGDAGAFAALREAPGLITPEARVVVVVAVDSFIEPRTLEDRVRFPPSYWNMDGPEASEGAAAMVLMDPYQARRQSCPILGTFEAAAIAAGAANDENDEPVDGAPMVAAMRQLPDKPRVRSAFGPWRVDLLRRDEWQLATARMHERFASENEFHCIERDVGRLGAASGLANAVYGVTMLKHVATDALEAANSPCLAWALSPDGTRGVAMLTGGRA